MAMMKPISKAAQKFLDTLVAGLEPGSSKKIDNAPGEYMALCVERLTEDRFSLAHYFEQNGDLVPDPDMELWRAPNGRVYPVNITQSFGGFRRVLTFGDDGKPASFSPRGQRELASFAALWFRNIKLQQRLGRRRNGSVGANESDHEQT